MVQNININSKRRNLGMILPYKDAINIYMQNEFSNYDPFTDINPNDQLQQDKFIQCCDFDSNNCWDGLINTCLESNPCANKYSSNCSLDAKGINEANQKRIWKSVKVDSSVYQKNKAGLFTFQKASPVYCNVNWNQMSDRAKPTITYNNVPSHGNSTKYSLTRHRPGACSAPGIGVDVKHGSYERYLLRKKGKCIYKTQKNDILPPKTGNKTKKYGVAYSNECYY